MRAFYCALTIIFINSIFSSNSIASQNIKASVSSQEANSPKLLDLLKTDDLLRFESLLKKQLSSSKNKPKLLSVYILASAYYNRINFLRILIPYSPNLELRFLGLTPLHLAILNNNIPIIKLLLEKGADQIATTMQSLHFEGQLIPANSTCLFLASKINCEIFDILYNYGTTHNFNKSGLDHL